jgi:hypothetical protein
MSLRSMWRAARLAASDTQPSRTQRSRLGSSAVPVDIQGATAEMRSDKVEQWSG